MPELDDDAAVPQGIALCLSGGGLRATFFHLGVITALRQTGQLNRVREVFSVSGGSITAGHLALYWDRYNSTDQEEFDTVCSELRAIGERDIRGRVLRRWILSLPFVTEGLGVPRAELLRNEYEFLFGRASLRQARLQNTNSPKFYVLATSFNTGDLCSFCDDVFVIHSGSASEGETRLESYPADNVSISTAVAASSAFPPLFPPLRLTWDMLGDTSEGGFNTIALTDGGVYDNLGFEKFATLADHRKLPIDCLIVSDGGGAFQPFITNGFSWPLARNVRATDILMRRVGEQTFRRARALHNPQTMKVLSINIGDPALSSPALATTQSRLQSIRTDLDKFSATEIGLLVDHGRYLAMDALAGGKQGPQQFGAPSAEPTTIGPGDATVDRDTEEALDETAKTARLRRVGLFNWSDWTSIVVALYGVLSVMILILVVQFAIDLVGARARQEEANKQAVAFNTFRDNSNATISSLVAENTTLKQLGKLATPEPADGKGPVVIDPAQKQPDAPSGTFTSNQKKPYTVWLQFAGSLTRDQMTDFGTKILADQWSAPGAVQGGERTPAAAGLNEVRYGSNADKAAAEALANEINAIGLVPTTVRARPVAIIPRNSLEIWISR